MHTKEISNWNYVSLLGNIFSRFFLICGTFKEGKERSETFKRSERKVQLWQKNHNTFHEKNIISGPNCFLGLFSFDSGLLTCSHKKTKLIFIEKHWDMKRITERWKNKYSSEICYSTQRAPSVLAAPPGNWDHASGDCFFVGSMRPYREQHKASVRCE